MRVFFKRLVTLLIIILFVSLVLCRFSIALFKDTYRVLLQDKKAYHVKKLDAWLVRLQKEAASDRFSKTEKVIQ